MGKYCTTTSIQTRMVGTNFDTATTALVQECITDAENEINKYISKRYDLSSSYFATTTSIPPMIKSLCTWLAIGYSYDDMARGPGEEPYVRAKRYIKRAIDNLSMIAEGKLDILDTAGSALTELSTGSFVVYTNVDDYNSVFISNAAASITCGSGFNEYSC